MDGDITDEKENTVRSKDGEQHMKISMLNKYSNGDSSGQLVIQFWSSDKRQEWRYNYWKGII